MHCCTTKLTLILVKTISHGVSSTIASIPHCAADAVHESFQCTC